LDCLREEVLMLYVECSEKLGERLPNPFILGVRQIEEPHEEHFKIVADG
jgi:hypothetical protein